MTALSDALRGGCPVLPVAPDTDPEAVAALQRAELPEGTALVVRTSGSSGVPKAVALSADALRASAEATHEELGGPGQWLVALPAHLISGLQMLVRSEASGIHPAFFDGPFDPERLLAAADAMDADRRYLSLVPVQLARLLDLAESDELAAQSLARIDAVLVGGQAVSLALRTRAHKLGVQLRRSYGMTETAGGCVYDGVEIGDTRVRIRGGEVQLAGSSLASGYVGDPDLTAERFIDDTERDGSTTRWYRTGDAGELLGGMLTVTGRLDRVLISGGVNVSLDEIERVARDLPGWGSAVALATEHPEWGQRPSLVVELAESGAEGALPFTEVRTAIRERLGAAAAPEWATEVEEIPRLAGGKPDLAALRAWRERLSESFRESGAARTPVADAPAAARDERHQTERGRTEQNTEEQE
ncbi:AMP-binding protein [Leucobacter sp. CSA2]|uniref:AMP-binding protein n=2 Tax=Leucobacter edaphi TaxID=2796472 RepID=A0A934UX04_9MICO|nr:AMP-binding protein [Leucobacter edaphi]MBK0422224.1 AMP-binding protein [Leucobacter edaphi]